MSRAGVLSILLCLVVVPAVYASDVIDVYVFDTPPGGVIPKPGNYLSLIDLTVVVNLSDIIAGGDVRFNVTEEDEQMDDTLLGLSIACGGPYAYDDTVDVRMIVEFHCDSSCRLTIRRVSYVEIGPLGGPLTVCPDTTYTATLYTNPEVEAAYTVVLEDVGDLGNHGSETFKCVSTPPAPGSTRKTWRSSPTSAAEPTTWGKIKALYSGE